VNRTAQSASAAVPHRRMVDELPGHAEVRTTRSGLSCTTGIGRNEASWSITSFRSSKRAVCWLHPRWTPWQSTGSGDEPNRQ